MEEEKNRGVGEEKKCFKSMLFFIFQTITVKGKTLKFIFFRFSGKKLKNSICLFRGLIGRK